MQLSKNLSRLKPSPTLALNQKAKELTAQGRSIINFALGEPDFRTPEKVCQAAVQAMERGATGYTASSGIVELRDAIIAKLKAEYGRDYQRPDVVVTVGAKHILFNLCQALLNEGDEVIIFAPYWVSYVDMVSFAGGTPVVIECDAASGFIPDPERLRAALTDRTRAILINTPSNPTGAIYTGDVLQKIARIVAERPDVVVITDDIYEKLVFDGQTFVSIAMMEELPKDQIVIVNGVSKSYAMTGWRIGYGAGPKELMSAVGSIQSQSTSGPTSIAQWAALEALTGSQDEVEKMRATFEERRNQMMKWLAEIPSLTCPIPGGAFYLFPSVAAYLGRRTADGRGLKTDVELASYLLEEHGLAVVPGSAFGAPGALRLTYASSMSDLEEGTKRLAQGLQSLS